MGNPTTPTPSALPQELVTAATAAGTIAQTILTIEGEGAIAAAIPLTEQLLATAIQAFTQAHGAAPTVEQLQALLGDVPLVPPPAGA